MTPAINVACKQGITHHIHQYDHDPAVASYGTEAAEALGLEGNRVFKTLLVSLNGDARQLGVAIVPVTRQLDLKACAKALRAKKADMANPKDAERATGYVVGGISPLGQKKRLPTVLDSSAQAFDTIYVSAGRRGLEIELAPNDLMGMCRAVKAAIAR